MSLSLNSTHRLSLPLVVAKPTSAIQEQATPPTAKTAQPDETALLKAYLEAAQRKVLHGNAGLITVPPQSTLGQWLGLYRMHLENAVVQGWLQEQHFAPDTLLSINPSTGTLSAKVEGKTKTFHLSDSSGWGQISGPLLDAAKVIAPGNNGDLRVRLGKDSIKVSAKVVANFEGVPLPQKLSQARTQIRHLEHKDTFDPIPADDRLRPASSRSPQALQAQKHNAANYYSTAPQALAYKRLAVDVADNLPNTRAEAKKWADDLLLKLTGKPIDSDTVYLNRFKGGESADTATGWEHTFQEPWSSLRLPDALLKNFSEHDWVPGNLDLEAGLYTQPAGQSEKGGYGKHNQIDLKPSQVMHESWKTDFQTQMTQKIDHFWSTHNDEYETTIKGEFIFQARKQLKSVEGRSPLERSLQAPEHQFTRDDYRLVMGAVSNLTLDENAPITVEQLKAKAPANGNVQAHALSLHGVTSSDIVRFSAADGGRQVLYIPGAEPAFLRFDSIEKLDQWLLEQAKDPAKREALAAHFPMIYRQDQTKSFAERAAKVLMPILWFTHVGEKKDGLDTLLAKMASGELKGSAIDRSHAAIKDDVFSTLATAAKERMNSDADVVIKSNSEVIRDTWLNDITVAAGLLVKLAPIAAPVAAAAVAAGLTEVALGAEKASSGDTVTERDEGASKAFDGLLNTVFSYGASAVPEDPFALPAEKELPRLPKPTSNPDTPSVAPKTIPQVLAVPEISSFPGMRDIEFNGRKYFVAEKPDAGDGINYVLRVRDPKDPSKLVSSAIIANPDEAGVWSRRGTVGGKWPWDRTPLPTPTNDLKTPPKISDGFEVLGNPKTTGADKFDEIFKSDSTAHYEQSINNVEEQGVIKRKLTVTSTTEEKNFEVFPNERAQPNEYSSTDYSPIFLKDLNRDRYTVQIKQPDGSYTTVELDATGSANDETLNKRLKQFEEAIPDSALRSRISEIAHQGSVAPTSVELYNQLLGHIGFKGKDTHYTIIYDPAISQTQVKFEAKMMLLDLDKEAAQIPNVEVSAKRTLRIEESNQLEESANPYIIDKNAPFTLSTTVTTNLK